MPDARSPRARAAQALAQASVLAEAAAQNLAPAISHGKPGGNIPAGSGMGTREAILHRLSLAHTHAELRGAVEWAEREVARHRRRRTRPAGESIASRDRRMIRDAAGFAPLEVAAHFRCGVREVERVRRAHGRDARTGEPLTEPAPSSRGRRRERARELRARGLSVREIATALGAAKSTVADDLAA